MGERVSPLVGEQVTPPGLHDLMCFLTEGVWSDVNFKKNVCIHLQKVCIIY